VIEAYLGTIERSLMALLEFCGLRAATGKIDILHASTCALEAGTLRIVGANGAADDAAAG